LKWFSLIGAESPVRAGVAPLWETFGGRAKPGAALPNEKGVPLAKDAPTDSKSREPL